MPRQKKDYKMLNMKVASDVMDRFNSYCEEVGQTKTLAFERIVTEHMDQYDKDKKLLKSIKGKKGNDE